MRTHDAFVPSSDKHNPNAQLDIYPEGTISLTAMHSPFVDSIPPCVLAFSMEMGKQMFRDVESMQ